MTLPVAKALPGTLPDPRYPDSDGRFMGDTDFHNLAMLLLRQALEDYFADRNVYVASNLVYYYLEGEPTARRDPDVLVSRGVGKHRRRSYRLWEEKVVPCVLFEIASRDTWRADVGEKRHLYARLGVKEYFVFDPEGRYLRPALQGFRTVRGKSVPLKPEADGSLVSKELGLRLVPEGSMLRLVDRKTGRPVPTRSERAEQEKQRADALQAEVERLRKLLGQRDEEPFEQLRENVRRMAENPQELWDKLVRKGIIDEQGNVLVRMPEPPPPAKKPRKPGKSSDGKGPGG